MVGEDLVFATGLVFGDLPPHGDDGVFVFAFPPPVERRLYSSPSTYFTLTPSKGLAQALATDSLGCVALGAEQNFVLGNSSSDEHDGEHSLWIPARLVRDPVLSEKDGADEDLGKSGDHRLIGSQKDWDLGTI
mmetsp:Transcript_22115/g.52608  ORF Transcript_22115/g.52608 Transcript_22115/m.52608 type:complete len:133 (+) Transcript_22115:2509-2907(+)